MSRRAYLDWLRGLAVIIMVEAHLFDAWVRMADRDDPPYRWAIMVGGFSAPLFLFLAGVTLMLAAGSRLRKGALPGEVAALARRRGWMILGLAFLFRLQSFVISGGPFPQTLLKVDILNVMGPAMLLAAAAWGMGRRHLWRGALLVAGAVAFAMVTPLVRAMPQPDWPYPIEWYFRSVPGSGAFTLFPWVGFLLLGAAVGLWLDSANTAADERRAVIQMAVAGPLIAVAAYAATYLPPLYADTTFWTGSPTYFFVRFGLLLAVIPCAYLWNAVFTGWSPLREMGIASLFVYWIHVEMVYGVASIWLHKSLAFEHAVLAYIAFCLFLYLLVKLKQRLMKAPPFGGSSRRAPAGGSLSGAELRSS